MIECLYQKCQLENSRYNGCTISMHMDDFDKKLLPATNNYVCFEKFNLTNDKLLYRYEFDLI